MESISHISSRRLSWWFLDKSQFISLQLLWVCVCVSVCVHACVHVCVCMCVLKWKESAWRICKHTKRHKLRRQCACAAFSQICDAVHTALFKDTGQRLILAILFTIWLTLHLTWSENEEGALGGECQRSFFKLNFLPFHRQRRKNWQLGQTKKHSVAPLGFEQRSSEC